MGLGGGSAEGAPLLVAGIIAARRIRVSDYDYDNDNDNGNDNDNDCRGEPEWI